MCPTPPAAGVKCEREGGREGERGSGGVGDRGDGERSRGAEEKGSTVAGEQQRGEGGEVCERTYIL